MHASFNCLKSKFCKQPLGPIHGLGVFVVVVVVKLSFVVDDAEVLFCPVGPVAPVYPAAPIDHAHNAVSVNSSSSLSVGKKFHLAAIPSLQQNMSNYLGLLNEFLFMSHQTGFSILNNRSATITLSFFCSLTFLSLKANFISTD